jgi:hypothetical protein
MKKLAGILIIVLFLFACKKDEDRRPGVCYCEFFSGDKQEYDLNHLSRQEQIDQCNTHDSNAANFGGDCELE